MSSPVFYILVSMALTSATLSIIFFLAWKTLGEKPYALNWSVGFLAAAIQWFININASWFSNHSTYWLLVNAFALVLITLGLRGHCQRTECSHLPKNLWPFAGIAYLGVVWATVIEPHVGMSMAIIPAAASITLFMSASMIVHHREHTRPAEWAAASAMLILAITQGIAAGMAAMQGPIGDESYQTLYVHYNFLTLPAGYVAMGMFVVFMMTSDIAVQMKSIALHDQLTGVLNRRGLGEMGAKAYARSRRSDRPLAVIMTDIDRFKHINDQHGHAAGDDALVHFTNLIVEGRRGDDIVARVGGEEFALVLPDTSLENALKIADELCSRIELAPMMIANTKLGMTASFGVAIRSAKDSCLTDTIVRADRALYRSKRAGRNQIDLESSQLLLRSDGTLKQIST